MQHIFIWTVRDIFPIALVCFICLGVGIIYIADNVQTWFMRRRKKKNAKKNDEKY